MIFDDFIMAEIERVSNGFILTSNCGEDGLTEEVFEDSGAVEESFIKLVWALADYFGVIGSKNDKERFWVGLVNQQGIPCQRQKED